MNNYILLIDRSLQPKHIVYEYMLSDFLSDLNSITKYKRFVRTYKYIIIKNNGGGRTGYFRQCFFNRNTVSFLTGG